MIYSECWPGAADLVVEVIRRATPTTKYRSRFLNGSTREREWSFLLTIKKQTSGASPLPDLLFCVQVRSEPVPRECTLKIGLPALQIVATVTGGIWLAEKRQ